MERISPGFRRASSAEDYLLQKCMEQRSGGWAPCMGLLIVLLAALALI
jgi:hypothetical protein